MNQEVNRGTILVVDDEVNIRRALQMTLESEGYVVHVCDNPLVAYRLLTERIFSLAILDIRMGQISGIDLFSKLRADGIYVPVIFVSGNASLSEAVQASRVGAFDFVEKPFSAEKITLTVERCLEHEALKCRVAELTSEGRSAGNRKFIGNSPAARQTLADAEKVARSSATVLIQGESGTGKELIAQLIHDQSERRARAFVKVNCSAIPETLIESELFGYERGAFTGAQSAKRGFFEQANGGTLFLDEIGDMSLHAQSKVLRALQSSEIQKLGSEKILRVDVRIIAATHRNLTEEVRSGRFREDLFYRISVVPVQTLPLRERREDVPLLITWFMKTYCARNNLREKLIDDDLLRELSHYDCRGTYANFKI